MPVAAEYLSVVAIAVVVRCSVREAVHASLLWLITVAVTTGIVALLAISELSDE